MAKLELDQDTMYAIKSIFLGASIHDAAILCYRTDRSMRDKFLLYCKHKNPDLFEEIAIEAVNDGFTTPPVSYFRKQVLGFFSLSEVTTEFLHDYLDDARDLMGYLSKSLADANRMLCIARARHQSTKQALNLLCND